MKNSFNMLGVAAVLGLMGAFAFSGAAEAKKFSLKKLAIQKRIAMKLAAKKAAARKAALKRAIVRKILVKKAVMRAVAKRRIAAKPVYVPYRGRIFPVPKPKPFIAVRATPASRFKKPVFRPLKRKAPYAKYSWYR